jgi:hypothetical protein
MSISDFIANNELSEHASLVVDIATDGVRTPIKLLEVAYDSRGKPGTFFVRQSASTELNHVHTGINAAEYSEKAICHKDIISQFSKLCRVDAPNILLYKSSPWFRKMAREQKGNVLFILFEELSKVPLRFPVLDYLRANEVAGYEPVGSEDSTLFLDMLNKITASLSYEERSRDLDYYINHRNLSDRVPDFADTKAQLDCMMLKVLWEDLLEKD